MGNDAKGIALGVDGGASVLKFAARTPDGAVARYECAGANPNLVGMEEFVARLSQGMHDALGRVGASAEDVVSAGLGLSGVDRPEQVEYLRRKLSLVFPRCARLWVGNDALPALRIGAGALSGVVLIAGTGSICFGATADGRLVRVGGWGSELGDEGSGYWIGQRAIQAVCRMADGRIPETELKARVLAKLGLADAGELIPWAAAKDRGAFKTALASLFPIVRELALAEEASAKQAILLAIGHLVQHVLAAESKLRALERDVLVGNDTRTLGNDSTEFEEDGEIPSNRPRVALVCAGGLFTENEDFFDAFVFQLRRKRDVFSPARLSQPAVLGALALGAEATPRGD